MNTQFHKMALYGITALIGAALVLVAADWGLSRQASSWETGERV